MLKGIDISLWQGNIDWEKIKDEVDFVIIRAGYGKLSSQKDARFEEYYAACERYNIPKGVYWFSYAISAEEALQEADACMECIKGKKFEYPVWFDYEAPQGYELQRNPQIARAVIDAFCVKMYDNHYFVGLYSYYSLMMEAIPEDIQARYDIWLAHYCDNTPYTSLKMWQYTGTGHIDGISGEIDMNYCYVDNYPEIIKNRSLNGYDISNIDTTEKKLDNNIVYPIDSSTNVYEQKHYPAGDKTQISKHFNVSEFACKCGCAHETVINTRLVAGLEKLFEIFDCSMIIVNSGYRHPDYDIQIGGFAGKHSIGDAADVVFYDRNKSIIPTSKISCAAQDLPEYFGGIANIDSSYTAIHLDVRQGYRWLGDETKSNNSVTTDFYTYYGLTKEDVYGKKETVYEEEKKDDCCHDPNCTCSCHKKEKPIIEEDDKEESKISSGTQINIKSIPMYTTAYSNRYSSKKSGTYFIYNDEVVNERIRITNSKKNVGRTPIGSYVSGWINVSDIK